MEGNVSKMVKIPGISSRTVRRAEDSPLKDLSRVFKNIPHKTLPLYLKELRYNNRGKDLFDIILNLFRVE